MKLAFLFVACVVTAMISPGNSKSERDKDRIEATPNDDHETAPKVVPSDVDKNHHEDESETREEKKAEKQKEETQCSTEKNSNEQTEGDETDIDDLFSDYQSDAGFDEFDAFTLEWRKRGEANFKVLAEVLKGRNTEM
jgi:hypothetical protein